MAGEKKEGVWVPEWVKNAVLGLLSTAVVGGYGMFYEMRSNIDQNATSLEQCQKDIDSIKAAQEKHDDNEGQIREDVASIKAELPYIKRGVQDIQSILRSR